jgi:hypothetical protein
MKALRKHIPDIEPCRVLKYCPYGPLVEDFTYHPDEHRCDIFGHECPAFSMSEYVEDVRKELAEINKNITSDTVWMQTPTGRIILGEFPEVDKNEKSNFRKSE